MNIIRTAALIAFLTALFMGMGYLIGGSGGMVIALIIACCMNLYSWWNSDKMVLRMQGAEEVFEDTYPEYYDLVAELAERAELPMPKVYVMHTEQPNAFATGRSPENAAVAASSGLLDMLDHEEVAGVIAHELAHIKNRDTLTMTISASIAGAISMLGNFAFFFGGRRNGGAGFLGSLVAMFVAPFAASIIQMAISRTREYSADRLGSYICGNPMALASALNKIAGGVEQYRIPAVERNHATAHMFIINPLLARQGDSLFSTHPSTENRIAALEVLAENMQQDEISHDDEWGREAEQIGNHINDIDDINTSSKKPNPWGQRDDKADNNSGGWGKRGTQKSSRTAKKSSKADPWGQRDGSQRDDKTNSKKADPWGKRTTTKSAKNSAPRKRVKKTLKNPVWGRRDETSLDNENSTVVKKSSGTKPRSSVTRKKSDKDNNPWD